MKLSSSLILLIFAGLVAFLIRVYFTKFGLYYIDLISFQNWSSVLVVYGFKEFYSIELSPYPPGYLYILWFLGKIYYWGAAHSIPIPAELILKMPSMLADIGNGFLIFFIAKMFTTEKKALFAGLIFLFTPAFFANSTYWGQIDSFLSFFLLGSFYFLIKDKYLLSASLLGIAQIIKPIAILSLPIFILFLISKKRSFRQISTYLAVFIIIITPSFVPFNKDMNLIAFIVQRNSTILEEFPAATNNAFNFWAIVSIFKSVNFQKVMDDILFLGLTYRSWGNLIFVSIYLSLLVIFWKYTKRSVLSLAFILTLCYSAMFLFLTRMHERHLFYGLAFMTLLWPLAKLKTKIVILLAYIIYTVNIYYAYRLTTPPIFYLSPEILSILSLINILIIFYLFKDLLSRIFKKEV